MRQEASVSPATYELSSTVLPRMGEAPAWQSFSADQPASHFHSTQHLDVTRWLTPGAQDSFGLSLGVSAPVTSVTSIATARPQGGSLTLASIDMGVRWRSLLESGHQLNITAWAQVPPRDQHPQAVDMIWQAQQPVYGTRAEVQWASSRTRGLVPEFGAVGVQLQGGGRLVLRARKGGPMLYYRAKF